MARHTPRYIGLKQPSRLSKGCQATPQGSLLLDEVRRLATHLSYSSHPGFDAAETASVALTGASWRTRYRTWLSPRFTLSVLQDRDVANHVPHQWIGRLAVVMVRGYTELRVRIDEDMSCGVVEMDGTPCSVLLGVTTAGADNLCTAITTGLAGLVSRRQSSAGDNTAAGTDG